MKGRKLVCLLAMAISCTGCHASTRSTMPGDVNVEKVVAPLDRLPGIFTGIWYPDDTEGASKCEKYRVLTHRALSPAGSRHDEVYAVPVGSLVITPNLIHAVAEYGEGNFYAVVRIEAEDTGVWRVVTRVGIDAMPDEPSGEDHVVSRLSLHRDKLQWQPEGQLETSSPRYARCAAARDAGEQPS